MQARFTHPSAMQKGTSTRYTSKDSFCMCRLDKTNHRRAATTWSGRAPLTRASATLKSCDHRRVSHSLWSWWHTVLVTLARSTYLTSDQLLLVMLPLIQRLFILLFVKTLTSPILAQEGLRKPYDRAGKQIHFNFPILNRLFGHRHRDDDDQEDSDRWTQGFRRMKGLCSSSGLTPQLRQNELELWKTKRMR